MKAINPTPGVRFTHVDRCANLTCPNRAHQGSFAIVATEDNVVGGHRPLELVLCAPCASALVELISGKGTDR